MESTQLQFQRRITQIFQDSARSSSLRNQRQVSVYACCALPAPSYRPAQAQHDDLNALPASACTHVFVKIRRACSHSCSNNSATFVAACVAPHDYSILMALLYFLCMATV